MSTEPNPDRVLRGLNEHERGRLPERYEILGELGRGGMAVVYRARDRALGREVALKVLRDDFPIGPEERARFRREGEAAARLSHPHIVPVFDAGETFLVLELVKGEPLDRALPGLDLRSRVAILEKVSRAVQHAHAHGIVHRDLKPANVLLSGGVAKVSDFGIARLAGETALTRSGSVLGTPLYMAPEQVQGRVREIGPRTDVYALGAMLYEMLAGRPPFTGEAAIELFGKIVNEEPARVPDVPGELEAVALRAIEKDPTRRYRSADDFAEELSRWLAGKAVLARPPSAWSRWRKGLARRRAVLVAGALGLGALTTALAVLIPSLIRTRRTLALWTRVSVILSDADSYGRGGEVGRSRERLDEGIRTCREFLSRHEMAEAHYFLGRLLRARGRKSEAMTALNRALELDPDLGEARFERGLLHVDLYGAALLKVQMTFAGRGPTTGGAPTPEELESHRPELGALRSKAIEDLSARVGRSDYFREVDAEFGRAEVSRMRWEWDAAREGFGRVIDREPLYVRARLSLALLATWLGEYERAIKEAGEAIDRYRGLGEAHALRAEALFWKAESAPLSRESVEARRKALADADRALELGEPAWSTRGKILWRLGEFDRAVSDYTKALELEPGDALTLNHRGNVRAAKGDLEGAIADYAEAIRVSPGFAMAWKNRALARALRGERAEALADAEAALRLAPPKAAYREEIEQLIRTLR